MQIPKPFLPVAVETEGLQHSVNVWGRSYVFGVNSLPLSLTTGGQELLAAPIRIVGSEDGEPMQWDDNYPDNESESFIQKRSEEAVTICGAMQSTRFIVDTCFTVGYDGGVTAELKLMPRGQTVAQVFGLATTKPMRYAIDHLWLEIPLREECVPLYSMFPASVIKYSDGTEKPMSCMSNSGRLAEADTWLPFKALLWLGNEERGFGWTADNDRNWQPADAARALELVHDPEHHAVILRVRLLDSQPAAWAALCPPENGRYSYPPLTFSFGFQTTPVKPFPATPYLHNALHLDCFIKVKGNYIDFMAANNRYDRLVEKGVTTLILHEKWNKSQNWFELSEFTQHQIRTIVEECHKRNIKVLTYFGYEISSMSTAWSEEAEKVSLRHNGKHGGGWYRVPFQRDYMVCYNNHWQDTFIKGVTAIMDTFHTDGIYLDGTATPLYCDNLEHGCGWRDAEGKLHGTYPVQAIRRMFRKLHAEVAARGGIVNVHAYGCLNFMALPYIDLSWYGENLQFDYCKGKYGDMPLDYFRAEYVGRNMGVPVELIAYENRPIWNFENAMALACIHGILPRPNDIEHPLDVMSPIWRIMDRFPVAQSEWRPYWNNGVKVSDDRVKVSYYRYTDVLGQPKLLAFCANTTHDELKDVTVTFNENVKSQKDLLCPERDADKLSMAGYDFRILYLE